MTIVEAIHKLLTDSGLTQVFIIDAPVEGACCVITPYASVDDSGGADVSQERYQVRYAAPRFLDSYIKSWSAFNALRDKALPDCDKQILGSVYCLQSPFYLDKDEKGRYVHTFNVAVNTVWKE